MPEKKWYCKTCLTLLQRPAETAAGNQAQGYCPNCSNMMWGQPESTPEPPPEEAHERAMAALRMSGEPFPYLGPHHATFERLKVGMQVTLPEHICAAVTAVLAKGERVAVLSESGIVGILVPTAEAE